MLLSKDYGQSDLHALYQWLELLCKQQPIIMARSSAGVPSVVSHVESSSPSALRMPVNYPQPMSVDEWVPSTRRWLWLMLLVAQGFVRLMHTLSID